MEFGQLGFTIVTLSPLLFHGGLSTDMEAYPGTMHLQDFTDRYPTDVFYGELRVVARRVGFTACTIFGCILVFSIHVSIGHFCLSLLYIEYQQNLANFGVLAKLPEGHGLL